MTGRKPVRDDLAADIKRIDRDLADLTKPGQPRDQITIDALLETRRRLTEMAAGLTLPASTDPVPEGPT